ncbi:MAG TPA: tetratricopeptide repeat protein [Candidatus Hydrogenedentes bacterium]|nr:tetratricopeptide repeat protein [Candidatus Hydrogenedentota bacterium]
MEWCAIMAELWELSRHVEEHPDDFEKRWQLAKKLYATWEYRLALEHLQVLRKEWQRKINVVRYLAATYYRLGRYDDAAAELRAAIETWPQEMGLREQLARVLEVAGKNLEAADSWERIHVLDPNHPFASSAIKRLRAEPKKTSEADLHLADSDSGIDLSPGRVCPNCGAQNSDEFDRCWQCQALLGVEAVSARNTTAWSEDRAAVITPENVSLAAGLVVMGLFLLAGYLSVSLLLGVSAIDGVAVARTFWDVYERELAWSRILTGIAMLVAWPLALHIALKTVKPERPVPGGLVIVTGLLLALLSYVASWLPPNLLALTVLLPLAVSLTIVVAAFGLGLVRALNVWALQLVLAGVVGVGGFVAIESYQWNRVFNPFREIPAVVRFVQHQRQSEAPGVFEIPGAAAPIREEMEWQSTGSLWLDLRAGDVEFTVYAETDEAGLRFEINQGETKPLVFEYVEGRQWKHVYHVSPGDRYVVKVSGPEGTPARVACAGLLIPRVLP